MIRPFFSASGSSLPADDGDAPRISSISLIGKGIDVFTVARLFVLALG
ncbi:MAG: hypothetical protein R3E12_08425 [Candidatus Eisenbacteria bacterium]